MGKGDRAWLAGTIFGISLGVVATLLISTAIAAPRLPGQGFFGTDIQFKRSGDVKLEIHANTDSVTADAVLLDIKTGNAVPTTKFSVDEDGDVYASGALGIGVSPTDTVDVAGSLILRGDQNSAPSGTAFTSNEESLRLTGSTSDYVISTQDGSGRIQHYWNSTTASGNNLLLVAAENAWFWDVSVTGDPYMEFKFFDGSAAAAGDTISWSTHMAFKSDGNVGIGSTSPTAALDVVGTTETNALTIAGDQLDATPTEIDQALDGISANVTAANLGTLTGGGNADALHDHASAGGSGDGSHLQQVWYDTDFTSVDKTLTDMEVSSGNLQLESSAPGTYYNFGTGTIVQVAVPAGGYVYQTFTVSHLNAHETIDAVYFYKYVAGNFHCEVWKSDGSAQIGSDSNTISASSYQTYYFSNDVDVSAETTIQIRIYNDTGAAINVAAASNNTYAGGQMDVNASYDMYNFRVYDGVPMTGTAFLRPDQPTLEAMESWEKVSFGTAGTGTVTIDLIRTDTDAVIGGYAGVSSDVDISGISTALNIGFKVTITRTSSAANPRLEWVARSFTAEYFFKGAEDTSGTTGSTTPWQVYDVVNAIDNSDTAYYSSQLTTGREYAFVILYSSTERTLTVDQAKTISWAKWERPHAAYAYTDTGTSTLYDSSRAMVEFYVVEDTSWNLAGGYYDSTTISGANHLAFVRDFSFDPNTASTNTILSAFMVGYVSGYNCEVDLMRDGTVRLDPNGASGYDFALAIFYRDR